jgi:N-acetylneuraminic acid mutarotase
MRLNASLTPILALLLSVCAAWAPRPAFSASGWARIDAAAPTVPGGTWPPARFDHTLTLDSASQKLILFGGRDGSKTLGDTWVYDPTAKAWHEVKATPAPPARFGHASAYDPQSRRVLIFAGQAGAFFNDVWAFDGVSETWQKLETRGTPPSKRYGASAVVDTKRSQLIVSHGFTDAGRFDDTLALDLATNTWSKLDPVGGRPLKRCLHEAVYDAQTDRMILFGGCSSGFGPCPQGDLWMLDVAGRKWTEVKPAGSKPSARSNPSLVNDDAGRVFLFGGNTSNGASADLWVLDVAADTWTALTPSGDAPQPRYSHDAVWNANTRQLIVFGGVGDEGALNDLWVYTP